MGRDVLRLGVDGPPPVTPGQKLVWMLEHKLRPTEDPAVVFDAEVLLSRRRSRVPGQHAFQRKQLAEHVGTSPQYISDFTSDKPKNMSINILGPITAFFFGVPDINVFLDDVPWDNARIARRMLEYSHVSTAEPEDRGSARTRINALFAERGHGAVNETGHSDDHDTDGEFWILAAYRGTSWSEETLKAAAPEVQQIFELRRHPELLRQAGYEVVRYEPSPKSPGTRHRPSPMFQAPTPADEEDR